MWWILAGLCVLTFIVALIGTVAVAGYELARQTAEDLKDLEIAMVLLVESIEVKESDQEAK